jgi:DNA-binding MarR family transcriptional regulator
MSSASLIAVTGLTDDELALWHAWKRASELVRTRVAADITEATGLSDPDFGVLTRVVEIGGGRLRQNALAESMGFHRSRLSHHLSRMEERGLITRHQADGGVEVVATPVGRAAVKQARPVHAAAVRRHLTRLVSDDHRAQLLADLERIAHG